MNIQLDTSEVQIVNKPEFILNDSSSSIVYGRECVTAAVKMLEKICKMVKHSQTFAEIPVACLNLVALVADFRDQNQVCVILLAGFHNVSAFTCHEC